MNSENQFRQASGLLTIHLTSSQQSVELPYNIPDQKFFKLKYIRVEYDTAANALADKLIFVDLPFLSKSQLIDNVSKQGRLPILLENNAVTYEDLDIDIQLSKNIEYKFNANVYKSDNTPVTNMTSITLLFSYDVSRIGQ